MTKLKCWKIHDKSMGDIVYKKKNGLTKLFITKEIDQYLVEVPNVIIDPDNGFAIKVYKKKSQALKFAKSYMKSHDKC